MIKAAHAHSGQVNERVAESGGIAYGEFQKDYSNEEIASSTLALTHQIRPNLRLDEGLMYVFHNYQYTIARNIQSNGDLYQVETLQPWTQLSWTLPAGKTTFNLGLHGLWWLQYNMLVEPRLSIVQRFGAQQTLSASWGLHSQTPSWWQDDQKLLRASQAGLRYGWRSPDDRWRLALEGFWQTISDAAALRYPAGRVSVLNESEAPFPYFFEAKTNSEGRNYGLETSIERRFSQGWFLLANATFFQSQTRLEGGAWEDSRWDLRRIVHLSGGKEWQKSVGDDRTKAFGCSGRLSWTGGQRAFPIDLAASEAAAATVFDTGNGFTLQQPDFFRLDGRVYWRNSLGNRRNSTFAMDFQNITMQENVAYHYYDPWTKKAETKLQLGLVPNLSWRLEF